MKLILFVLAEYSNLLSSPRILTVFWRINYTSKFGVIWKFDKHALCDLILIVYTDDEQRWT